VRVFAPGRVNLIGDHTDTTGGLVLPMAIELGTTIDGVSGGEVVRLSSDSEGGEVHVPLGAKGQNDAQPGWGRFVAAIVDELRPNEGFRGHVTTTLPVGAGLSSSTSLVVAVSMALAPDLPPLERALACQRAEIEATGVPGGIMDQVASVFGVEGNAMLIDCTTLGLEMVPLPEEAEVVVVHSGEPRTLSSTAYAERRASCEAAEQLIGPLRTATESDVASISDDVLRRRATHVVSENARVRAMADALADGDLIRAGSLMNESHASLREDFEVSTTGLDELVEELTATSGVYGARLTGAGFGGCVVALSKPGVLDRGWRVKPSDGAQVIEA
jgi:galactokinase